MKKEIEELQSVMASLGVDAYIITTNDFHGSEYVGDYFKTREFMSGFTGSAGTLVVLSNESYLWTDGRYFIQAEKQLQNTGIKLMRAGEENVPSVVDFLFEKLEENSKVGFDGRMVSRSFMEKLQNTLSKKNIIFSIEDDLVDRIWKNRPDISKEKVWEVKEGFFGEKRSSKIEKIRKNMKKNNADFLVLTALDEIAYLTNLRGGDILYTPVFLGFMLVSEDSCELFAEESAFSEEIIKKLEDDGIRLNEYSQIYDALSKIPDKKRVMIDFDTANCRIIRSVNPYAQIINCESPAVIMKAVKTKSEADNIRQAHIKDGVAVTEFLYWLKNNVCRENITEMMAAVMLEKIRSRQEGYIMQSFAPIVGYAANGAIVHYEPSCDSSAVLMPRGLCLIDTGAHYDGGTTDITRTIPLGPVTEEEKRAYTLVLIGNLRLADAKFKYGVSGTNLDIIAREPLWEHGLDYNHGTGHGVGYILGVHEGPQRIGWQTGEKKPAVLEEGMIISDEPGFYAEGKFGVRHENLLMVKNSYKNEYGRFMEFETLTMVPFDIDGIDISLLNDKDIELFNAYQQKVFDAISGFFEGEMLEWLRFYCRKIEK